MQYIGIQTQKSRNNTRSLLLLFLFPTLVVGLVFAFCYLLLLLTWEEEAQNVQILNLATEMFVATIPYVLGIVLIWFLIAYFTNTSIIKAATGAKSLERKENKRVYNLVENLCMSQGMKMPKLDIIYDNSLNAYASGINDRTYTVTLTKGIIDTLEDDELEAVIAHELSHIRNRDVRLLIVSIVFVGIFSMIAQIALRTALHSSVSRGSNKKDGKGAIVIILLAMILAAIGYFFATLMRFAISRKREYLADAGASEMTKNPQALASALRKISQNPDIQGVKRDDVAQLFIQHPKRTRSGLMGLSGLFATHPPIEKRIQVLEQF